MNPARREPLLWLQLLGLSALPLEALALLLVLAGADPGLFPGFERLLTWALGAVAPAVLYWRLPPDLWSVLLLQVPLRGRRPEQLRLSALQTALPLKLLAALGAPLLLPLLWWADASAGLAWAWSPLNDSPRLVGLLVALPLLALMLWQWHQLVQALWMLTRPAALLEQTLPLTQSQAAEQRLNLGLPLLLLPPLEQPEPVAAPQPPAMAEPESPVAPPEPEAEASEPHHSEPTNPEPAAVEPLEVEPIPTESVVLDAAIAVEPEQAAEEQQGADLNAEITEGDDLPGGSPQGHGGQADSAGGGEGEP